MKKEQFEFILENGEGFFVEFKEKPDKSFARELVENMGTGINKMNQLCLQNNVPKPEYVFNEFFTIIFKRVKADNLISGELSGELNKGQFTVYQLIQNNNGINATEISKRLQMPFSTVDKHIRILIKKSLIERHGSKKTGDYFVK